jgi:hypothetical protein
MENKSAVEWYNQQIVDRQNGNGDSRSFDEIFQQAKEIEHQALSRLQANIFHRGFTEGMKSFKMLEYDLDELAIEYSEGKSTSEVFKKTHESDFKAGFKKALELLNFKSE